MDSSNTNTTVASRFNVVIRVRPENKDDKSDLITEEDLIVSAVKLVNIYYN
jgi:hypothetical protein